VANEYSKALKAQTELKRREKRLRTERLGMGRIRILDFPDEGQDMYGKWWVVLSTGKYVGQMPYRTWAAAGRAATEMLRRMMARAPHHLGGAWVDIMIEKRERDLQDH